MTTVDMFFSLNTGAAEREMEAAIAVIRFVLFVFLIYRELVSLNLPGNQLRSDPDNHSADLFYFTFRYVLNAADIDNRAPDKSLSL